MAAAALLLRRGSCASSSSTSMQRINLHFVCGDSSARGGAAAVAEWRSHSSRAKHFVNSLYEPYCMGRLHAHMLPALNLCDLRTITCLHPHNIDILSS